MNNRTSVFTITLESQSDCEASRNEMELFQEFILSCPFITGSEFHGDLKEKVIIDLDFNSDNFKQEYLNGEIFEFFPLLKKELEENERFHHLAMEKWLEILSLLINKKG